MARVQTVLGEIANVARAGAVYHGLYDSRTATNGRLCAFCEACLLHPGSAPLCRQACVEGAMHALSSGEPYFYRCWAGLLFVTVAVAPGNVCRGGISLGGFRAADEDTGAMAQAIRERLTHLPDAEASGLVRRIGSTQTTTPADLRGLGNYVLEATFSSGLNPPAFFQRLQRRYTQQRRIAEAFEEVRRQPPTASDIPLVAGRLFDDIEHLSEEEATRRIAALLACVMLVSRWDVSKVKAHLRVVLALLTSQSILAGASWQEAAGREMRYMTRLEQAHSTEDCCTEVSDIIAEHFRTPDYARPAAAPLPERVILWLQRFHAEAVSMDAAAKALGHSVSSLSHQLKRETGKSFRALLREVRVAAAKRLLATTDLELSEIAARCGFYDQSHFTRTMKSDTSLTPGEFRRILHVTKEDVLKLTV